jgi:hypothetical protein
LTQNANLAFVNKPVTFKGYQSNDEVYDGVNQLFQHIFVNGEEAFYKKYDPFGSMLQMNSIDYDKLNSCGWRLRLILQLLMQRVPPAFRTLAARCFDRNLRFRVQQTSWDEVAAISNDVSFQPQLQT